MLLLLLHHRTIHWHCCVPLVWLVMMAPQAPTSLAADAGAALLAVLAGSPG
jgi:hypothetical protein